MRRSWLLAVAAIPFATSALALDDATCRVYADNAVAAARAAASASYVTFEPTLNPNPGVQDPFFVAPFGVKVKSCGYSGPRWSQDWNLHHQWCLGAPEDQVSQEEYDREYDLAQCQICDSIADVAMADIASERAMQCGFSGARWRNNWQSQYQVCWVHRDELPPGTLITDIGRPQVFVLHEQDLRRNQIEQCAHRRVTTPAHQPSPIIRAPAGSTGRLNH